MSEFIRFAIVASSTAIVMCIVARLLFRRSFLEEISYTLVFVCLVIALMAFFTALFGLVHLFWAIPLAVVGVLRIFYFLIYGIRNPLNEIAQHFSTLS